MPTEYNSSNNEMSPGNFTAPIIHYQVGEKALRM